MMNKTLKYNGAEVTLNWQAAETRKRIANLFEEATFACQEIKTDSIEDMEKVEAIYREAFSKLFGEEKCKLLFPEGTGLDGYFEFIDMMIQLKNEQDEFIVKQTEKFAALSNLS